MRLCRFRTGGYALEVPPGSSRNWRKIFVPEACNAPAFRVPSCGWLGPDRFLLPDQKKRQQRGSAEGAGHDECARAPSVDEQTECQGRDGLRHARGAPSRPRR